MPVLTTYPGVYIEELPSSVRPITGVATSITAFVGYTSRGIDNRATTLLSFGDFERAFGGLAADSELSYAVQHFFLNGGSTAVVVRVPKADGVEAGITLKDRLGTNPKKALTVTALSKGAWANEVTVDVDYVGIPTSDVKAFNLTITDAVTATVERFAGVTMDATKSTYVVAVVNDAARGSQMVKVAIPDSGAGRPVETGTVGTDITMASLKNDKDYGLKISLDVPTGISKIPVTVIATGEAVPTSVVGLCQLVERKLNLALATAAPGVAVRCVPAAGGKAIRVYADVDRTSQSGAVDAVVTFDAAASDDVAATLGLIGANVTANVGHYRLGLGRAAAGQTTPTSGLDGTTLPGTSNLIGSEAARTGIFALEAVDLFNLLCIPDAVRAKSGDPGTLDSNLKPNDVYDAALAYCTRRRAFLLIDPPPDVSRVSAALDWIGGGLTTKGPNAAAYFPRLRLGDPLDDFASRLFAPSGVIAGVLARTDAARGVWKAAAGTEATLVGVREPAYRLTDGENGQLNPLGLNCLRTFPVHGNVAWGARTRVGADVDASQWKYVPVRRLALMIEESVFRGTKWAVFEPNDERLWGQLRLNLTSFMHGLFRLGAFQGTNPRAAYLVKCDAETTTQDDIDRGTVNIVIGFAPLKPAEFVVIRIQQLAGQTQA
jgi:phage tail sheath protein FI